MRGAVLYLPPADIVARATSLVGQNILYHLEYPNGGTDPTAKTCAAAEGNVADCIGFATWAGGFDRFCPADWPDHAKFPLYDGYINTDSMVDDATGAGKWFKVNPIPAPGMFIVGASYTGHSGHRVIGHIGVITAVTDPNSPTGITVAHCSPSNYVYTSSRSAIWATSAQIWFNYYPKHYYISLALTPPALPAPPQPLA